MNRNNILARCKNKIRSWILTPEESSNLSFWQVFSHPEKHFEPYFDSPDTGNFALRVGRKDFGWIERVDPDYDKAEGIVKVAHFAVSPELAGTGFGKRMAVGFGMKMKAEHGARYLLFCENVRSKPFYTVFFENTLRAQRVTIDGYSAWLWEIE